MSDYGTPIMEAVERVYHKPAAVLHYLLFERVQNAGARLPNGMPEQMEAVAVAVIEGWSAANPEKRVFGE